MPDILIRGMEMPPEGEYLTIEIAPDGSIWKKYDGILEAHAVELSPHGDLCDRSVLLAQYDAEHEGEPGRAHTIIENAPVVVPAERRESSE